MAKQVDLDRVIEPIEVALRQDDSVLEGMSPSDITTGFLLQDCVSLKKATNILGVSHLMYTRQLLWNGRLEGVKIDMGSYQKWFLTKESISYYKEHTLRSGKPKKYILRVFSEDQDTLIAALRQAGIFFELTPNYQPTDGPIRWSSEEEGS